MTHWLWPVQKLCPKQSLSGHFICLRATATTAAASTTSVRTLTFGLPRRTRLPTLGIATSTRAIGRATGTTPTRQTASPSAASRTHHLPCEVHHYTSQKNVY